MTATRSEMWRTTERSCATKRYVSPNCAWRSSRRLMICAWIDTSSADTGSSQTISDGSTASARAIPHALALAARELVRIAVRVLRQEPDEAFEVTTPTGPGRVLVESKYTEHWFYECSGYRRKPRAGNRIRIAADATILWLLCAIPPTSAT